MNMTAENAVDGPSVRSASSQRLHALDALRYLAVLLVIGCHGVFFHSPPLGPDGMLMRLTYTAADRWPWALVSSGTSVATNG